jgi:hypothetical protein
MTFLKLKTTLWQKTCILEFYQQVLKKWIFMLLCPEGQIVVVLVKITFYLQLSLSLCFYLCLLLLYFLSLLTLFYSFSISLLLSFFLSSLSSYIYLNFFSCLQSFIFISLSLSSLLLLFRCGFLKQLSNNSCQSEGQDNWCCWCLINFRIKCNWRNTCMRKSKVCNLIIYLDSQRYQGY